MPQRIRIHNAMTNIVGRARLERMVSGDVWRAEISPLLGRILSGPDAATYNALIGRWVVQYRGNEPHMREFFEKNWKPAPQGAEPIVRSYVVWGLKDREVMKKLLGLASENDVDRHAEAFLKASEDKKFAASLRDPKLRGFRECSREEQREIALFSPATIYCSEERAFVSLNTNYYGQLKSKSSLGPLEEFLIRAARFENGRIVNPGDVWLSMHAGCVEYRTDAGEKRGIVIIAPTGTGKSTHGYGLVEAKKENRLHSDDWLFVNVGTREVLISESRFYMRTNIAGLYPHLIPMLVEQPLENVPFSPETVRLLEGFESSAALARAIENGELGDADYRRLVEEMIENNAARSLIDPRLMVGPEKFTEKGLLTDLFLLKRDYDSTMLIQKISPEEAVEILTSKGNVYNYTYGRVDADSYGIPQPRTTEIYYNPYLCVCEVDREAGVIGPFDQIRIEAYRELAAAPGVTAVWVNSRLPAAQTQFCLRFFLEGRADGVLLQKGRGKEAEKIAGLLGLKIVAKPPVPGRRDADLTGFLDERECEAEMVCFFLKGRLVAAGAFLKQEGAGNALAAWVEENAGKLERLEPDAFFQKYATLGARSLFAGAVR